MLEQPKKGLFLAEPGWWKFFAESSGFLVYAATRRCAYGRPNLVGDFDATQAEAPCRAIRRHQRLLVFSRSVS